MITTVMQNQSRQSPCLIALSRHKKEFKNIRKPDGKAAGILNVSFI
jgi:hypothetical protein